MSAINGVNNSFFPNNLKTDQKAGQDKEGTKKTESKENFADARIDSNKLIIEMHLKIQVESKTSFGTQAGIERFLSIDDIDLTQLTHTGQSITDLTKDEAAELVSDDGFYGIEQTAQRIFDFVASMAGEDPERLKIAKDAVLKGFKDAEKHFGGSLPDISHDTISKALELIDGRLSELGGSVVDIKA